MRQPFLIILLSFMMLVPIADADGTWQTFELLPVDNSAVPPGADALVPAFNDGSYFTFDLMILNHNTRFDMARVEAALTGQAEFFLHPAGNRLTPSPNQIAQYPALEYDTFFEGGPGAQCYFAPGELTIESQYLLVGWYVWRDYYYGAYHRIARFSIHFLEPGTSTFTLEGVSVNPASPGLLEQIGPFTIPLEYIPEPATLALLAGAGLLVARRRS